MKIDKSLQDVWDWKEKVYEEMQGLSIEERITSFKKASEDFCKKYELKFKKLQLSGK